MEIYDAFPLENVEVWLLNRNAGNPWLINYRDDQTMHEAIERINIPIMHPATQAYAQCQVGAEYDNYEPAYLLIDKFGIIRDQGHYPYFPELVERITTMLTE